MAKVTLIYHYSISQGMTLFNSILHRPNTDIKATVQQPEQIKR